MPDCKKCQKPFPRKMVIEGKERNLINRSYCLECSPFGLHNTRNFEKQPKVKSTQCEVCGQFYIYHRAKGMSTKNCSACTTNKRRRLFKQKCVDYKGGKCCICGYNKANSSLIFHHLNPEDKDFTIGSNYGKSWDRVQKEIDKCVLLCQNCHGEVHEGLTMIPASLA